MNTQERHDRRTRHQARFCDDIRSAGDLLIDSGPAADAADRAEGLRRARRGPAMRARAQGLPNARSPGARALRRCAAAVAAVLLAATACGGGKSAEHLPADGASGTLRAAVRSPSCCPSTRVPSTCSAPRR
ncbi:hypothetical protein ACU686_00920 [Yinghuangia aomiensis]